MGFYDYSVKNTKGEDVPMSNFKGKVVLVVNTATGCGFTPQYKDLESIYEKYYDKGLEDSRHPLQPVRRTDSWN